MDNNNRAELPLWVRNRNSSLKTAALDRLKNDRNSAKVDRQNPIPGEKNRSI